MSEASGAAATTATLITIRLPGGGAVAARATVPAGPTQPSGVVPALHRVCDALVADRVESVLAAGADISCRFGCGACCRQLVPILETEAAYLAGIVDEMPAERRAELLARWQHVLVVLEDRGLLGRLRRFADLTRQERRELVVAYFRLGLACPFLEAESCSIYAERPLACREYLVTSPPEACRGFGGETVTKVPMPNSVLNRLLALNVDRAGCLPLILALDPAAPQATRSRGIEVLAEMLGAKLAQSDDRRARYVAPSLR